MLLRYVERRRFLEAKSTCLSIYLPAAKSSLFVGCYNLFQDGISGRLEDLALLLQLILVDLAGWLAPAACAVSSSAVPAGSFR